MSSTSIQKIPSFKKKKHLLSLKRLFGLELVGWQKAPIRVDCHRDGVEDWNFFANLVQGLGDRIVAESYTESAVK